ncbi:MAG: GNAT family N-acetyltransferase [Lewinellaceae bacterium]|nr:GNAT family N-acetyltransferase [Lewinellaceae bacterium]
MPSRQFIEKYIRLSEKNDLPFQAHPWWLDTVCGPDGWDVALAFDADDQPIGALPFGKLQRSRLPILKMPPFTAYFPVWLKDMGADRTVRQYHWEHRVLEELISQLPSRWLIDQQYAPELTNGLPFHSKGFKVYTRYTYQLEPRLPVDAMWADMESATRNAIRKAKTQVRLRSNGSPEQFYELVRLGYRKKDMKPPFSLDALQSIDDCLTAREMRTIYMAEDEHGQLHAACYVVWDRNRAYGLLNVAHPEHRKSGAQYRVLWQALKDASKRGATFDFEGSMLPRIERVFRSFGAKRVPYIRVVRYQNRFFEAMATLLGKNR